MSAEGKGINSHVQAQGTIVKSSSMDVGQDESKQHQSNIANLVPEDERPKGRRKPSLAVSIDHQSLAAKESKAASPVQPNSANSNLSSGSESKPLRKILAAWKRIHVFCHRIYWMVAASEHGLQTLPVLWVWFLCAVLLVALHMLENIVVPSLHLYNTVLTVLLFVSEMTISAVYYAVCHASRWEAAIKLLSGKITLFKLMKAAHGTVGKLGGMNLFCVLLFELTIWAATFTATWSPVKAGIGTGACNPSIYNADMLTAYSTTPDFVQGDTDFASIYMYGLPLLDGMLAGFGAWPAAAPLNSFSIDGRGPALLLETVCDHNPLAWNYTSNKTANGNGLQLIGMYTDGLEFSATIDVILPNANFQPPVFADTKSVPWVHQICTLRGILGYGLWTFSYEVDEWLMVTVGQAVSVSLIGGNSTVARGAGLYANSLRSPILASPPVTEVAILMPAIIRVISEMTNNTWFAPSQSGQQFSNLFQWGTKPNGYYYADRTWRGLSAGLGSTLHQIFMQYAAAPEPVFCNYSGENGTGAITLDATLVWIASGFLIAVCTLTLLEAAICRLLYPIHEKEHFKQSVLDLLSEWRRLIHAADYVSPHILSSSVTMDIPPVIAALFDNNDVRLGESHQSVESEHGRMVISNTADNFKLRPDRTYI